MMHYIQIVKTSIYSWICIIDSTQYLARWHGNNNHYEHSPNSLKLKKYFKTFGKHLNIVVSVYTTNNNECSYFMCICESAYTCRQLCTLVVTYEFWVHKFMTRTVRNTVVIHEYQPKPYIRPPTMQKSYILRFTLTLKPHFDCLW